MTVHRLCDLRDDKASRNYIRHRLERELSPQERIVRDARYINASIKELLATIVERDDLVLIARSDAKDIMGYALLTEHVNTWTGSKEGFIYSLNVEEEALNTHFIQELWELIYDWGSERHYDILRAEIREGKQSEVLIRHMQASGWMTSGIIPCKLLSTKDLTNKEQFTSLENIHTRSIQESDYSFVIRALAEAIWVGLSPLERSQINFDALVKNVSKDFEDSFRNKTSLSFVAESTVDGLCAHTTARVDCFHPILDIPEAELIDVYILPSFSNRGIGEQLTAEILSACLEHDIHFVRSTVVAENAPPGRVEQICSYLIHKGWWLNSRVMYLVL